MAKFKIVAASGATPIDPDEAQELIPDYVATMEELNQAEQSNIADAYVWAGKQNLDDLLTGTFIFKLHERMFGQIWKWAGKMRRSNKNIGVHKENIMTDLGQLLGDAQYWVKNSSFPIDEIAARFHHRLVQIHVFPNGNGRHARLMTDLFLEKCGGQKFTWGTLNPHTSLEVEGKTRTEYITALRAADDDNFVALIQFARS